uniref:Uncharacterized protein n=1 Tax=Lepeophtheirus salmonis TaxID=72036 RepID=A0A0K2UPD5_LEPSM
MKRNIYLHVHYPKRVYKSCNAVWLTLADNFFDDVITEPSSVFSVNSYYSKNNVFF